MRPAPISVSGPFQAIAHRGDRRSGRENTLPAVAAAIRAGADAVEIDVKTTADGEVVVLHDDSLQRLWDDPRRITDCRSSDLPALGAGQQQIPTLDAVLGLVGGTGTSLMIDMDADRWAEPAWRVVRRAVGESVLGSSEVVWCGRPSALQVIRDLDPQARIVLSWDEGDGGGALPADEQLTALSPEAVNPHWPMITADAVGWARRHELALCCWTVDEEQQMRRLIDLGVQAMITNQIALLRQVLDGQVLDG